MSPFPALDFGHVIAVPANELLVLNQLVANRLLGVCGSRSELRHAVDHVAYQVETIELVQYAHVERCARCTLFFVAPHVKVPVARSPVGKPVNEPWVAVEGENDWLVSSEQRVEIVIREAMRMLTRRLQFHEIHDVDNTHLQVGCVMAEEVDGSQSLQC